MSVFGKIVSDIRSTQAVEIAGQSISAAHDSARKSELVAKAEAKFTEVGVAAFIRAQAAEMTARRFWNVVSEGGVSDRASISIEFVPQVNESFEKGGPGFGVMSTFSLNIQSFGTTVHCGISARSVSENLENQLPLDALTAAHVEGWFERFIRFAFEARELEDRKRADRERAAGGRPVRA